MEAPGEKIKLEVMDGAGPSAPPMEGVAPAPLPGHPGGPTPIGWAPLPAQNQIPPNSPPGLEYLVLVDQLLVHQKMEAMEMMTGWETENKYEIKNSMGQKVYFAEEDSGCCGRCCCGNARAWDVNILDNFQKPVMRLSRGLKCSHCCFPCCLQEVEVQAPVGTTIGYVTQDWSLCRSYFTIHDAERNPVLKVKGPCYLRCKCFGDIPFEVLTLNGEKVGKVTKQWSGVVQEAMSDADNFGITFPMDLDVKVKASLLAACLLIDFMFFEERQSAVKKKQKNLKKAAKLAM